MVWYRFSLYVGIRKVLFPVKPYKPTTDYFLTKTSTTKEEKRGFGFLAAADKLVSGYLRYFGYDWKSVGDLPEWSLNPFNGEQIKNNDKHWTRVPNFSDVGDIKNIWEASRFNWAPVLAVGYVISSDEKYLNQLNNWCRDWTINNQPNIGVNWKCGQETSIRVLNLLLALIITGQDKYPSSSVADFIYLHLKRVKSNILYAVAQDNNHAVSEAAALYIGGSWLETVDRQKYPAAVTYSRFGEKWLENRVGKLIMNDGSFTQHSIVYHRMVLDILSLVEYFRHYFKLHEFSAHFYGKVTSAINWYAAFIDPKTGGAPNLGANDGTILFDLFSTNYRDFKPSLNFVSAIYGCKVSSGLRAEHPLMEVLRIPEPAFHQDENSLQVFKEGGYCKLAGDNSTAFLRLPSYRFRPSHADALHVDIWQNGINWIRDAGSYSYALPLNLQDKYSGTNGHSTIQFDHRNQMPRISRFLFGRWLKPMCQDISIINNKFSSGYIDYKGAEHIRQISAIFGGWKIIDEIQGEFTVAVQRWILAPGKWSVSGNMVNNGKMSILINAENIKRLEIIDGQESLYYMSASKVPILEVELNGKSVVETKILFS